MVLGLKGEKIVCVKRRLASFIGRTFCKYSGRQKYNPLLKKYVFLRQNISGLRHVRELWFFV
jgi:hypothetical protein